MKFIALLIASLMILFGLTGVLWPEGLMGLLTYSFTSSGIYVLAVVRMVLGALLLVAAKATRTPKTVRVIGVIIFAAGVATALTSVERAQMLKDWWVSQGPDSLRIAACIPLAVGCFIAGSTVSRRS
jgi:membrane-bound ClpP family serine protease